MSLFNNKKTTERHTLQPVANFEPPTPTLDEQSEDMKAVAIEYLVSLDKRDFDSFVEGVTLIWQGYNNNVDKVRTRHQKALQRNLAKANGSTDTTTDEDDDELIASFLDDEEVVTTPPATTLPPLAPKRPLGGATPPTTAKKVEVQ